MKKSLLILLVAGLFTTGCVSTGSQTGDGALIGAGAGALLGQAIGGNTGATLAGAAIGAGAGALIGNNEEKKNRRYYRDNYGETYYLDNNGNRRY